jgi:DHA1 family multidrug resistance protein-like MFS transporter
VLLLVARSFAGVLLTAGLFVLITAFLRPAIHSLISRRTTVGQGMAMGMSNSFVSLGRVVGPIWAGAVFDVRPSYPYLSGAVILVVVFLLSLVWIKGEDLEPGVRRGEDGSVGAGARPSEARLPRT